MARMCIGDGDESEARMSELKAQATRTLESNGFRRTAIVAEIHAERDRQDEQWGGPDHDDTHVPAEWFGFIQDQDDHFTSVSLSKRACDEALITATARERLIKIAALAIAAVESIDRKAAK